MNVVIKAVEMSDITVTILVSLATASAESTHVLLASMPWTCRVLNEML